MSTWRDSLDRQWTLAVTIGDVRRVQQKTGVNLMALAADNLCVRLHEDPALLMSVLYSLVGRQAESSGVSEDEFLDRHDGRAVSAATAAFWEGIAGFFRAMNRVEMVRLVEKTSELVVSVRAEQDRKLSEINALAAAVEAASTIPGE